MISQKASARVLRKALIFSEMSSEKKRNFIQAKRNHNPQFLVQGEYRESTGRARERHAARREECMLAIKADCVCLMELYVETFLPVAQVNGK